MTQKDYILIARVLKTAYEDSDTETERFLRVTVDGFCTMLERDNAKFDPAKFRKAIYGEKV